MFQLVSLIADERVLQINELGKKEQLMALTVFAESIEYMEYLERLLSLEVPVLTQVY